MQLENKKGALRPQMKIEKFENLNLRKDAFKCELI